MILGYDTKRPQRENYEDFVDKFVTGLSKTDIKDLSLMLYGSYVRGDYVPGRSDIDGVLIFLNDIVLDKAELMKCSEVFCFAQCGNNVPLQISVSDRGILRDGRFSSYGDDFEDYFLDEGAIYYGSDYRHEFKYLKEKSSILHTASFNLRKSRNGLLRAVYDEANDYSALIRNFEKGLDVAVNSTKQIAYLKDKNLRKKKFSSLQFVKENYPNVDLTPLDIIRHLYRNPSELDSYYQNTDEMIKLWKASLDTFENLIKAYIEEDSSN